MNEPFSFHESNDRIVACRRCPRLVAWREEVALTKRRSFQDWEYWGKPVPRFGDPEADRLIIGLAPAAHGANRTGRMFTGDRSGDWVYRALHKAGVASQPCATHAGDGLKLTGVVISATAHCAPPANKPTPEEISNCNGYLREILEARAWRSILCFGGIAWQQVHRTLGLRSPKFGHGVNYLRSDGTLMVACYHPSQQNTFTGKLTEAMFDEAIGLFLGDGVNGTYKRYSTIELLSCES